METCHGLVHRMRNRSARQRKRLSGLWSAEALCRWGTPCRGRACRLIPLAGIGNDVRRSPSRRCPYPERGPSRGPSRSRRGRRLTREPPDRSLVGGRHRPGMCALALGVVSVVFGLLGQGGFGIVAIVCGHQARRRMARPQGRHRRKRPRHDRPRPGVCGPRDDAGLARRGSSLELTCWRATRRRERGTVRSTRRAGLVIAAVSAISVGAVGGGRSSVPFRPPVPAASSPTTASGVNPVEPTSPSPRGNGDDRDIATAGWPPPQPA